MSVSTMVPAYTTEIILRIEGLFAPRAGQHYRDEQRRRRSQYDRGTRLAALEDFDYEEALALKY